jgi:thiamine kinase-like enzyme
MFPLVDNVCFSRFLQKLAQLHASALALKINNTELFNEIIESLEEVIYKNSNQVQKPGTESCIEGTATHLRMVEPQTPELKKVADYFSNHVSKCYDKLYKMFNGPKLKYHTICHGDPWNNNLLFLHDDSGNIVDLKMVDYQICRYTSVSTDILYLIYASAHSSLIENSYETLIEAYHDELIKELRRKSVSEEILAELGMDWLQAELKEYSLYGVLIGCVLVHPMLADEADAERFENINVQDTDEFINNLVKIGVTQKKLDRIRCVALHYYRNYVCER